ncbi:MAG: hypothetical protein GY862_26280 [Gammaproteobacteria bacterium]|nr:hypothetical protein [Gammaproteobacteria bacterium]
MFCHLPRLKPPEDPLERRAPQDEEELPDDEEREGELLLEELIGLSWRNCAPPWFITAGSLAKVSKDAINVSPPKKMCKNLVMSNAQRFPNT